jgi:hypothetical protein
MKASTGGEYIGGLWENMLPGTLLWALGKNDNKSRRLDSPYAPSWSWASITGVVRFTELPGEPPFECLAEVLEVSVKLASENPFGSLLSGFIRLKGLLAEIPGHIEWPKGPIKSIEGTVEGGRLCGELYLDVTDPSLEISSKDEAAIMIIACSRRDRYSSGLHALVLKSTKERDCYRRVGAVDLNWLSPDETESGPDFDTWRSRILKTTEATITIV